MRCRQLFVGVGIVGLMVAGFMWYRARETASLAKTDKKAVLLKVAKQRFQGIKAKGVAVRMMPKAEQDKADVYDAVAIEMLKDRLVMERLQKEPNLVAQAEDALRQNQPRLLHLTQNLSDGTLLENWVVAFNTLPCSLQAGQSAYVRPSELDGKYCLDPVLESPGGFDPSAAVKVDVLPSEAIAEHSDAKGQWDQRVTLQLREKISDEFVANYRATGQSSL